MIKYAGVGSRNITQPVRECINYISQQLDQKGYHLRSGGAMGSDAAFELKSTNFNIFTPLQGDHCYRWFANKAHNKTSDGVAKYNYEMAAEIAALYHPVWDKLTNYPQRLLTRNAAIILGQELDDPVDFVLHAARLNENGEPTGGTSHTLRIAEAYNVPIYGIDVTQCKDKLSACQYAARLISRIVDDLNQK